MARRDDGGRHVIAQIHHVAILTADIEAAVERFAGLLGNRPGTIFSVDRPEVSLRTAMIAVGQSGGTFVQLIQPSRGPGVEELVCFGEGTLYEVAFEVKDIELAYDQLMARGERLTDALGQPLHSKFVVASSGNRYFYLAPLDGTGPRIEVLQIMTSGPLTAGAASDEAGGIKGG